MLSTRSECQSSLRRPNINNTQIYEMRRLSTVNMRLACHNNCTSCLILCANRNKSHPLLNDTASDVGLYRIPAPAWILPFVHIRLKSGSGQNLAGFSDFSRIFKMLRWPTDLLSALSCLCQHKHFFRFAQILHRIRWNLGDVITTTIQQMKWLDFGRNCTTYQGAGYDRKFEST